jgi:hypothetical protein
MTSRNTIRTVIGILVSAVILVSIYSLIEFVSQPGIAPSPVLVEGVKHFFTGVPLAAAVAMTILLGATIALPGKLSGPLKILQGVSAAIYFFYILNGGLLTINFASGQVQTKVVIGLLFSLGFLEASSIFRTLQGLYESFQRVMA